MNEQMYQVEATGKTIGFFAVVRIEGEEIIWKGPWIEEPVMMPLTEILKNTSADSKKRLLEAIG